MAKKKPQIIPFRSAPDDDPIRELGSKFNLGPKSSVWLYDAGVRKREDILELGSIEVCRRIMAAGHPISVVVAYALEGGMIGRAWDELPPARKFQVKRAFDEMKVRCKRVIPSH